MYRARTFSHNQYHNVISLYCDILGKTESEAKEFLSSIDALEDSYLFLSFKEREQISTEKLKRHMNNGRINHIKVLTLKILEYLQLN